MTKLVRTMITFWTSATTKKTVRAPLLGEQRPAPGLMHKSGFLNLIHLFWKHSSPVVSGRPQVSGEVITAAHSRKEALVRCFFEPGNPFDTRPFETQILKNKPAKLEHTKMSGWC